MARSIFEQTGWKRPHAATLLMDTETLKLVTEYDYDLSDEQFEEYARRRGCMNGAFREGSRHRMYVREHWLSEADFLADEDPDVTHPEPSVYNDFSPPRYTEAERRGTWQVIALARAALQDCWEVYESLDAPVEVKVPVHLGQTALF